MNFIDKENMYANNYNALSLCEYTRELKLIKRLIDIADETIEKKGLVDVWSFEGVCHSFARTIVDYSKMAYDNILLGHFHATNMINRAILENSVCLDIIINNHEYELWKYYLIYSCRSVIYKSNRKPDKKELEDLEAMYRNFSISEDFYIIQESRKKAYIKEPYGWTYKINTNNLFNFENICKLAKSPGAYKGFQLMSDYSHGTSFYLKMFSSVFAGDIMSILHSLYIELYIMITLYCQDLVDKEFYKISEELELIFCEFLEEE